MTCTKTEDMTQPKTFTGSTEKLRTTWEIICWSRFWGRIYLRILDQNHVTNIIQKSSARICSETKHSDWKVCLGWFWGKLCNYAGLMTAPLPLSTEMMCKNPTNQLNGSTGAGYVPFLKASFIAIHQHPSMNLQNQPIKLLKHINLLPYQSCLIMCHPMKLNKSLWSKNLFKRKAPEYALRALFFWVLATLAVSSRPSWSMACMENGREWTNIQVSHCG